MKTMLLSKFIKQCEIIKADITEKIYKDLSGIYYLGKIEAAKNKLWITSEKTIGCQIFDNSRFNINPKTLQEILSIIIQLKKWKNLQNKNVEFQVIETKGNKYLDDKYLVFNFIINIENLNYTFYLDTIKL